MGYIGCFRTFFGLHVDDDGLASMSYTHRGALKESYVFPPDQIRNLKELLSMTIYNASIFNMIQGSVRPLMGAKVHHFNTSLSAENWYSGLMYAAVQMAAIFIVNAPMVYHYGLNIGYNEAEVVKYSNSTRFNIRLHKNKTRTTRNCRTQFWSRLSTSYGAR